MSWHIFWLMSWHIFWENVPGVIQNWTYSNTNLLSLLLFISKDLIWYWNSPKTVLHCNLALIFSLKVWAMTINYQQSMSVNTQTCFNSSLEVNLIFQHFVLQMAHISSLHKIKWFRHMYSGHQLLPVGVLLHITTCTINSE